MGQIIRIKNSSSNNSKVDYIRSLHNKMLSNDLILVYEGEFSQEITKSVLRMSEKDMDYFGENSTIKKDVFNIMVECLQNISLHANEELDYAKSKSSIFIVGKDNGSYSIASGNYIKADKIAPLKSILKLINKLDKAGLKTVHQWVLSGSRDIDRRTPGLGLIDIARKSQQKLENSFEPIDDNLAYFSLRTKKSRK